MRRVLITAWLTVSCLWIVAITRAALSEPIYYQLQQTARENVWLFLLGLVVALVIALTPPLALYAVGDAIRRHGRHIEMERPGG